MHLSVGYVAIISPAKKGLQEGQAATEMTLVLALFSCHVDSYIQAFFHLQPNVICIGCDLKRKL